MTDAKVNEGKNGFEKDKADEQNDEIDQVETTYLTDAVDTGFWYLTFVDPNKLALLPTLMSSKSS